MADKAFKIIKIRKRDGRIVEFAPEKITNAIFKAAQGVAIKEGKTADRKEAEELCNKVITILEFKFSGKEIPTVEEVQDVVEKVLIKSGHAKTAKGYILYREQHAKLRETKDMLVDVGETIKSYIHQEDWRVKENSNEDYSFSGLLLYAAGKVIGNYALNEIYTPEIKEAHVKGYFHIHDLSNAVIGYCAGWSLKKLLEIGFGNVPNKVDCKPAKHLNTVIHQMVNYIGCLQMEFAGAQAFSSVDTLLAPFIKADNLSFKEVKQCIQQLVFSLNIPNRWGCFSEDTEILTESGWTPGKELKAGDIIATFNTENEKIEYLAVERVTKDHYKGKMHNLKNRIMDQLVTPNHRVLRRIHNFDEAKSESKYVFEEARCLKTKIPLIPLGGKFKGVDMHEDYIRALAWIVSEGSLCRNERICISQSFAKNPEKCGEIRACLNNLEIPFDEQIKQSGFTGEMSCLRFRINRPFSRKIHNEFFPDYVKKIPESLRNLNTDLARIFIETYMKADGHPPENKIYTKNKEDADMLQEIIVKTGWGSTCYKNKNGIYAVRVIKHEHSQITSIEQKDYDGIVWCPTTKNNTVVVRRNGKVFISGNSQYPFSNLTFDWTAPADMKNKKAIVGGKKQDFTYAECQKEMDIVNKAFLEVMLEGDAKGRIFTFPIPTYNLTKDFEWDSENAKLLFEATAKYGMPYFQNYVGSNLDPKSIRAMCCRLNLDQNQLVQRPGGMWGPGDATGSVGVVTLNMNRLGYEAKTRENQRFSGHKKSEGFLSAKEEFFEKLGYYMNLAKDSLEIKRVIVEKNLKNGLMPFAKTYLGTFKNHFSTIGLCGMNECCRNFLKKDISTKEGAEFTVETLEFMRGKLVEFQQQTGNLYNLEATPAESTSYRLARLDKKMHPGIITAGEKEPYLTNSTQLPVDKTDDLIEAIEHQNQIQPLYTGGTIFHTFLGEKVSSGEACKKLVRKIASNTRLPYFSITPTFSICPEHGYIKGEVNKCPECGIETEVYSRIVGYYRPIRQWNNGKKEEFKERLEYLESKGLKKELKIKKIVKTDGSTEQEAAIDEETGLSITSYKIFTLPSCDKCRAAKTYLNDAGMTGAIVDLSNNEGLKEFRGYYKNLKGQIKRNQDGSLPIPTILFFDDKKEVVSIAHNAEQAKVLLEK